ncbi:MAG: PKD domain-containing protein [Trueperaceae bacterium]
MPDHRRWSVPIFPSLVLLALLTACTNGDPPVVNRAPTANAGPNQNVTIGNTVTLDANASSDADGDALTFTWAFENRPDGSTATLADAGSATPTFVPVVTGAFVATLSVSDGQASASDSITITATSDAPNAAPALSSIEDQRTFRGEVIEVPFTITDEDPANVTVEVSSSDTTLIANTDLEVLGGGADRSLRITPAREGSGSTVITLVARDAGALEGSAAFTLNVTLPFGTEFPKLTASDAAAGDQFGYSVAMSGDYAVIGARADDDGGFDSGSAYVFQRSGDGWVQSMKLPPEPPVVAPTAIGAADRFGSSVAISSDYIIVGAPGDEDTTFEGAAYVYERCSRFCQEPATEMGELTAGDAAAADAFGFSVAISGDHAIIGAPRSDDDGSNDSGSVYVFRRDGDTWTEVDELTAGDPAAFDYFGRSVAMSGDYAVIGAIRDDGVSSDSGAAYVFRRSGDTWTEMSKLTASDAAEGDLFGWSVAMSGDYAIVGAIAGNGVSSNSGAAYVFRRSGDTWTEMAKLTASDAAEGDFFGNSVAMDGDFALVGAFEGDGVSTGSAYVFHHRDGTWSEVNKLTASDAAVRDAFGFSVAISGDYAIIGANQSDNDGTDSGSVYVFLK